MEFDPLIGLWMLPAKPRHYNQRGGFFAQPRQQLRFNPLPRILGGQALGAVATLRGVSLFKSASTVSLMTLASRVTGLVRDLFMASTFGANALTDAFNVAFRIPNLFRRLFAEGAFSQAFVPVLAASHAKRGQQPPTS